MAKIQEELIVIKLSKLHKDSQTQTSNLAGSDIVTGLEAVVQELVGADVIVEVIQDNE
jgi:phage-related protein